MSSILPKNEQKQFDLRYQKSNFFVCFLGELKITKKTFRNQLIFRDNFYGSNGSLMFLGFQNGELELRVHQKCKKIHMSKSADSGKVAELKFIHF